MSVQSSIVDILKGRSMGMQRCQARERMKDRLQLRPIWNCSHAATLRPWGAPEKSEEDGLQVVEVYRVVLLEERKEHDAVEVVDQAQQQRNVEDGINRPQETHD